MDANTSRIPVELTQAERQAFEEFRQADRRGSLSNAIVAAALLGLNAWRAQGKPAAFQVAAHTPPEAA